MLAELRYTIRSLRRNPGFAVVAILTLALGIGANTAIFSGVNALLLGPMPYGHPEQLAGIWEDASVMGFPRNTPAPANYVDWRRMNHVFSDLAALRFHVVNLTGGGHPELVMGRGVTANFFDVLGAHPMLGRSFTGQEDSSGAKVAVIGHSLWQRRFGGSRDVIGQTLRMNDQAYTVIGVMPAGFAYPDRSVEFWDPAHFDAKDLARRSSHFLNVVARLKPGVTVAQAQADMSGIAAQLARQYPDTNRTLGAVVLPLRDQLVGDTRTGLLLLLTAAGFVLLIACANVANLLLIRGAARKRELAVRAAVGASRPQLIRQLATESLVIGVAGALLGLLFASAGMSALQILIPQDLVNSTTLSMSIPLLAFATAVSLVSSLVFGLVPALHSSRVDLNEALKQGGRAFTGSSNFLRKAFVVSQVAIALVLVAGAGLLIQTLANLRAVKLGFPPDHLLTMLTPLSPQVYNSDPKILSYMDRVVGQVGKIPGVRGAGFASDLPFTSIGDTDGFLIENRPPSPDDNFNDALYREVSSNYLQVLGAHLASGRLIDSRDGVTQPLSVVINETFAHQFWPHQNPVGARLRFSSRTTATPWRTIVGVVADVKERGLTLDMKPAIYVPAAQVQQPSPDYLIVRTALDPVSLTSAIRSAISSVDPEQPVSTIRTMDEYAELEIRNRAHQMDVFALFAALALFLASLGIHGVLAYSVTQRRREIGVRIALGARTTNVTGLILKQGMLLTLIGLAVGSLLAAGSMGAMRSLLFGVSPLDPVVFSAGIAMLLLASLAACLVPALSASRVDPMLTLKDD
jgi:putative ABC transport system permease protein